MTAQKRGSRELFDEVIDAGSCTLCGACAGGCPYLAAYRGRIVLMDKCTLSNGQCYRYCPRTRTDMNAISRHLFGVPYRADALGTVREVLVARSTDAAIRQRAQYGGTVTALLSLALDERIIGSAILTRASDGGTPVAFRARSAAEVLHGAGSSYMACPVLEALNKIPEDSQGGVGIVVTPCQALALAKMKREPPQNRVKIGNVRVTVGLFCTWALSPIDFQTFLKGKLDPRRVKRFDIPPPPANRFDAYTPAGRVSFPLERVRKFIMPGCASCLDMTAEFADISVGSLEGSEGWNTVIVRTEAGADLLQRAIKRHRLEIGRLPAEKLAHLREAALLKKNRALREIVKKSGKRGDLLYPGLTRSVIDKLLA